MSQLKFIKKNLLDKAHAYADFLNSAKRAANANPELKELVKFIDSFVDYAAKSKADNSEYPIKIVRQNYITKEFVPAYFNIDALVEKWDLVHELYSDEEKLRAELSKDNDIRFHTVVRSKDEHDASCLKNIKERNLERREEQIEELKSELMEWNSGQREDFQFNEILRKYDKKLQDICHEFKKLSLHIEQEELFNGLVENYSDRRKLRNYVNSAVFHAMANDHSFKADVLAKFNYHDICNRLRKRGIGKFSKPEILEKLKEVFSAQLRKTDISDDTLIEYFNCFFKANRSGKTYKITGLNPYNLPTPRGFIGNNANLFELFIFPST